MSKLFQNLSNLTKTENGAYAFASSSDPIVNLFVAANAFSSINDNYDGLSFLFTTAWKFDKNLALRCMLQAYDCRKGGGRRDAFKVMMEALSRLSQDGEGITDAQFTHIAASIKEYGRWDMYWRLILHLEQHYAQNNVWRKCLLANIAAGLQNPNEAALCAKWLPRKGAIANRIRGFMKLKPAEYRHLLSAHKTTETQMSANQWSTINYEHVPSKCALLNSSAFSRHDYKRYCDYIDAVKNGKATMHTSVTYPYEIVANICNLGRDVANAAWDSLLKNAEYDRSIDILPIVDVSGSMDRRIVGNITAMDVAIALGLYIAQTNQGAFKNEVVSFSEEPQFISLTYDTMCESIEHIEKMDWGMNTDFNSVFETMLTRAKNSNLSDSDLPRVVMVFSDMEFDEAGGFTGYEMIKENYAKAGYTMPLVVFWNIGEGHPFPALASQPGVIEVSGFSSSIIKPILECDFEKITPSQMIRNILMNSRYDIGLNL